MTIPTSAQEARIITNSYLQWTKNPTGLSHSKLLILYQEIREHALRGFSNLAITKGTLSPEECQELISRGYRVHVTETGGKRKAHRIDW